MTLTRHGHVFERSGAALVPSNEHARAAVHRIPKGHMVSVDLRLQRDPAALRRWHALVGETWENTRFGSADAFADAVKLMVGFAQPIRLPGDRMAFVAHSSSPADYDQIVFSKFLSDAERFVADLVAGGDVEAVRREAAEKLVRR